MTPNAYSSIWKTYDLAMGRSSILGLVGRQKAGSMFESSDISKGLLGTIGRQKTGSMFEPSSIAKLVGGPTSRDFAKAQSGLVLADALRFRVNPAIFDRAGAFGRDLVIAEPGDLADELDIAQDADATGFVWPCPSLEDLKTAQHLFWLSMALAVAISLTVTDRIPDPVTMAWCGTAERSLAFAIWLLECRQS